ncbi:MAG TPA: sulfite exporter TauE/SafE family protein [Acidimicrobiales bacterium]
MTALFVGLLAVATSTVGAVGGLGGAVFLVPLLVVTGTDIGTAAPLGLLSVAAGSLAAASRHAGERTVNHRLGVTIEVFASAGAIAGALAAGRADDRVLQLVLAAIAAGAAVSSLARPGLRNRPVRGFDPSAVGEWRGELAGAYALGDAVVPYRAGRLPLGLAAMVVSGLIAGVSGVSGGFVKTPVATDILRVPLKVAAPTTTFTVGVTSAAALLVYIERGNLDVDLAPAVVLGSIVGGAVGASVQARLAPTTVRRLLTALLVAVAGLLVVG